MREILFRGKRIDNGEWVEGWYLPPVERDGYIFGTTIAYICEGYLDDVEVDPSTVGQYTGLTDKNGKRIFEGDIVQAHFRTNHSKQIFRVTFDDGMFIFNNGYVKLPVRGIYRIKVIGNVHDNPEYMKEGADNG